MGAQESFERGVLIGLWAAKGMSQRAIEEYATQMQETVDERWNGHRVMRREDIFLAMPLMAAADIGL